VCTSLTYRDAQGRVYFGRTLELTVDLPYQVVFLPIGAKLRSSLEGRDLVDYEVKHAFISVAMPGRIPTKDAPLTVDDFKPLEGMNQKGLTFSLLSYPAAGGGDRGAHKTSAALSASDLGSWALGQFATVKEVKAALAGQPVMLEPLALLGGVESPFHYIVHDRSGDALVIEFHKGVMNLYDNPVGVMTNGPDFPWHLKNLDNYTYLSNVDKSGGTFGGYTARQPDSGIATAGLPASNTSVGRFVRAAYFAQFTEAAEAPDTAVQALAHIMNNFDRPRGATIDYPGDGGGHMEVAGLSDSTDKPYVTEFTCWTNLSDLDRTLFFVRTYRSLNYASFDLAALATLDSPRILPLDRLEQSTVDATVLLSAAVPA
jgi:penicillin V acylase-like amidase (Ntn superfamily)